MTTTKPPIYLPARDASAHKGDFGRTLLVGGSRGMSGSIALSSIAALRTGSGLVTAAVPDRCLESVASFSPCVMTLPLPDDSRGRFDRSASVMLRDRIKRVSAVGCGPGMTTQPGSISIVEELIEIEAIARVLDADAINVLAALRWDGRSNGPTVLTPHPGEWARLTGIPAGDRTGQIKAAEEISTRTGVIVVLKGGPTQVVGPAGIWTNTTGNPGMATAGSGDVLTGIVASLLGQHFDPWDAARLGVWIHGRAGDIAADQWGQAGMTAHHMLDALPLAVNDACDR